MRNEKIKRVIHVVSDMHRGGAETMIMNLYRNIDRSKLQFDFICHYRKGDLNGSNKRSDYEEEIVKLGGRIFKIPSLGTSNPIEYVNNIKKVLIENGPFEAIHVHTNKQAGFSLLAAKLARIDKRIVHSHTANWNTLNSIYMKVLKLLIKFNANMYCACGQESAISAFGKKFCYKKQIKILTNSIDVEKYIDVDEEEVKTIRKKLNIGNTTKIIGHVGRIDREKNHKFIIKIAQKLIENNEDFLIVLVGAGPMLDEIRLEVKKLNLSNNVKFLGVRKDINLLMNLFDVFILPSIYEGLPLVTVEAQAAGKRCIVSEAVSNEIDMGLNLVKQLPINEESLELWKKEVMMIKESNLDKKEVLSKLTLRGYNVKTNINKLYKLYGLNI